MVRRIRRTGSLAAATPRAPRVRAAAPRTPSGRMVPRVVPALALAVALAACSSTAPEAGGDSASSSAAPAPTSSAPVGPPSSSPATPTTSPFSGRPGGAGTPIVVVKLDNTPSAQPHRNLVAADMVYVEPVEGGLTRLAALYSTTIPAVVGPVRSARIGDVDVFAPLGDIAFVYSGAQKRLRPVLAAAAWRQVSPDLQSPGFHRERGTGRVAPYNLMAEPQRIVATSGATAVAQDVGLRFTQRRPGGGTPATRVTARWPSSWVQFRWNAQRGAYDVWMNGRRARDTEAPGVQRASSVLVQYVRQVDSGYGDRFGGRTPLTVVVGSGSGLLLRDGRSYPIRWSKPEAQAPTTYSDSSGRPVALHPGQVWVLLLDRSRTVRVG